MRVKKGKETGWSKRRNKYKEKRLDRRRNRRRK